MSATLTSTTTSTLSASPPRRQRASGATGKSAGIRARATGSSSRTRRWFATSRRARFASFRLIVSSDDLASSGLVALMEAIDRFDPAKGASFEQYAWTRVAGALVDELRKQDWASRSVRREGRRIERARDSFFARAGTMPTEVELARELGTTVDDLRTSIEDIDRSTSSSLNAPVPRSRGLAADRGRRDDPGARGRATIPSRACSAPTGTRAVRAARSPGCSERERHVLSLVHVQESPARRSAGCSASASRGCRRSSRGSAAS